MIRSHTFRGHRWRIMFVQRPTMGKRLGDCEGPKVADKTLRIREDLSGLPLMQTLIHEALHACVWDLDEEAVHESSVDMGRLLWRMGFRQEDGGDGH